MEIEDIFKSNAEYYSRVLAKITDVNGCWEWNNYRDKQGYGQTIIKGKRYSVHRASWQFANGPIPSGMMVLHKCDNPPCCNPDHLFLGTNGDNMRDRAAKKRYIPAGSKNTQSKLTESDVLAIREDNRDLTSIASDYRVGVGVISRIIRGLGWTHLIPDHPFVVQPKVGTHGFGGSDLYKRLPKYNNNKLCSVGVFLWEKRATDGGAKRGVTKVRVTGYPSNIELIHREARRIAAELDAGTYNGPKWVRIPGNW